TSSERASPCRKWRDRARKSSPRRSRRQNQQATAQRRHRPSTLQSAAARGEGGIGERTPRRSQGLATSTLPPIALESDAPARGQRNRELAPRSFASLGEERAPGYYLTEPNSLTRVVGSLAPHLVGDLLRDVFEVAHWCPAAHVDLFERRRHNLTGLR